MNPVLLLIPTTSYRAEAFLEAARSEAVPVVVGSDRAPVLAEMTGGGLHVDLGDAETAAGQIAAFHARQPLAAIIGVDEGTAAVAARASEVLGLPHNPPHAAAAASHKARVREALWAAGVPQPSYRVISPEETGAEAARRINHYPAVLKPVGLAGSRGVLKAEDSGEFASALERVRAIAADTDAATGLNPSREVVAEAYLPGGEVALEGLLLNGTLHVLALFDKPEPMEGPTFEETIFTTPSRLPADTQAAVRRRTQDAVAALGLTDGPIHAELRLTPDEGPVPLEVAPRSIGGLCGRVLRFGTGLSLEGLILRHAVGRVPQPAPARVPQPAPECIPEPPAREAAPVGVMMLPVPAAGTFERMDGLDEARALDGVDEISVTIAPGTPVRPLPEGDRYLGFIFAHGDDPASVTATLQAAAQILRPVIEPE